MQPERLNLLRPEINEALIREVVHAFYARIRTDDTLAPIFNRAISDWEPHLEKMCAFWSGIMLMSGRYRGKPMLVHQRLKTIRPEHFTRWLTLFRETAHDVCSAEVAEAFIDRAERIAQSLQHGMFFQPGTASQSPGRRSGEGRAGARSAQ